MPPKRAKKASRPPDQWTQEADCGRAKEDVNRHNGASYKIIKNLL